MSKLWIKIDYIVAATLIKGMRSWLDKMEELLDDAQKKSMVIRKRKKDGESKLD